MLKKILNNVTAGRQQDNEARLYNKLLRHEARVGGKVFGSVPKDHRREFFCLDEHTWVWHEEWADAQGEQHVVTTRYDVRPQGILKSQNGSHYQQVSKSEARRLHQAAQLYYELIKKEVYNFA